MTVPIDVSVVVGANPQLIIGCLDSLLQYAPPHCTLRIVVICNSPNASLVEQLHTRFGKCELIINENTQPCGFAENHNRVLANSTADYVLILNDDLVFLPQAVEKMVEFMERPENQKIAMLSPRLLNPDGTLQPSTYSFPSPIRAFLSVSGLRQLIPFAPLFTWLAQYLGKGDGKSRFWAHDRTIDVDTFRGACVLGRMKAIREVGPMVTVTRAGGEEVEWHLRLRRHGWRVVFYHEVGVVHYGSQTINTTVAIQNEYLKGFLYFFKQHHTKRELYTFGFLALVALWLRCAKHLWSGQKENAQIDLEGINLIRTSL